ncbi:MFS transporter [Paenibacillus sp. GCM10027629]|uniref:MFS transporter n=1 Tax=Paenibacillus sp. GCM10027629 TaxID=3273414 RepID=UPI00362B5C4F
MLFRRNGSPMMQDFHWLRMFVFSLYTTTSLITAFFPLYFSGIGFSNVQIGFIYSIGPLISIFSNLIWGIASDKFRTIKKIVLILLVGQLFMVLLLTQSTSFAVICILMFVFNFFYSPINPLADTWAIMTMQKRGKNFMSVRIYGSFGFAIASLVLGFILKQTGAHITLWVCLLLTGCSLLIALFATDQQGATAKKMELGGLLKILKQREIVWFFLLLLLVAVSHRFNDAFISPVLRGMGADETIIGWALSASSLSEIPVFFLLSKYGSKFKELPLLSIASLMYAVRFLLMSVVTDPAWVVVIQLMHSVTFGIYFFTAVRYVTNLIPDEYRATGLAFFTIIWSSLAGLISGSVGGSLLDISKGTLYMVAASLALIGSIGFMARYLIARDQ